MPLTFRAVGDTQLSGAFVVDPAGTVPDDRVLVITDWSSLTLDELRRIAAADDPGQEFLRIKPRVLFAVNGRAWPNTERLTYTTGDTVRWRVVNLSTQLHPMHLHGFYFDVDAIGDGMRDKRVPPGDMRVFTQLMPPGSTMALTWHPERVGNWLFHCHILPHVSPSVAVDGSAIEGAPSHEVHDAAVGMTGMVLGITVVGPEAAPAAASARPTLAPASRKLTMVMRSEPGRYREAPAYGFVLEDDVNEKAGPLPVPGPTLVLERDAPVEITLVNRLPESTAIHWHGMELESYYDGVHGYSGTGQRVTPLIRPGESFVVRFTPPRAGTFMYHTHMHDGRQLTSGLYGAMIVTEPGGTVDPAVDHALVDLARRAGARRADRSEWRTGAAVGVESEDDAPAPARQHHPGRRLHRRAEDRGWSGRVASGRQGRDPAATRALRPRARDATDRRRRDVQLRGHDTTRPQDSLAGNPHPRGKVAGAGAGDHQVAPASGDVQPHPHQAFPRDQVRPAGLAGCASRLPIAESLFGAKIR